MRKALSRVDIPAAKEIRKAGVGFASVFGVIAFQTKKPSWEPIGRL